MWEMLTYLALGSVFYSKVLIKATVPNFEKFPKILRSLSRDVR